MRDNKDLFMNGVSNFTPFDNSWGDDMNLPSPAMWESMTPKLVEGAPDAVITGTPEDAIKGIAMSVAEHTIKGVDLEPIGDPMLYHTKWSPNFTYATVRTIKVDICDWSTKWARRTYKKLNKQGVKYSYAQLSAMKGYRQMDRD